MNSPVGRLAAGALWPIVLLSVPVAAATITVDSTFDDLDQPPNGNCTLREAIVAANGNAPVDGCVAGEPGPGVTDVVLVPAGIYVLAIAGAGEDAAQSGDLDLTDSVSIEGAGARSTVIDAAGIDRVFDVGNVGAAILDVTLRAGDAGGGNGGGIQNGGTLTVAGCAIEGSSAAGPGGGVRNDNDIFILDSTLSGNTTGDHGGGMDDHGSSLLENVTVSGNTVTGGGLGGGLYNLGGTTMTVRSSTIVGNISGAGTGLHNGGSTTVANLLLVGSCDGAVATSSGGSLESPGNGCGFDAASDQVDVADPALGVLEDNGGGTDTHALLAGGPAIDTGETGLCPDFDQRGEARPFDGDHDGTADCDVGAFEYRLPLVIFEDGFESGDTSAWSSTLP
jgi:CSLREA domain-containing protein